MKCHFPVVILFFSLPVFCFGQPGLSKNSVSLSLGASVPVGNFSKTDMNNDLSGFAKTGEYVHLTFEHRLGNGNGPAILLRFYGQRNGLNTQAFADQFKNLPFYLNGGPQPVFYSTWNVQKKAWMLGSLMAGVKENFPLSSGRKFSFFLEGMIGAAYLQAPTLNAVGHTDTSVVEVTQSASSGTGISYCLGTGITYAVAKNLQLTFHLGYFGTGEIKFKNVTEHVIGTTGGLGIPGDFSLSNSLGPTFSYSNTGTAKQTVGSVNAGVGLIMLF